MGGGFGGCTINLVKEELYDAFIEKAFADYKAKFGFEPKMYPVVINDGARQLA
jgi:galactokinase